MLKLICIPSGCRECFLGCFCPQLWGGRKASLYAEYFLQVQVTKYRTFDFNKGRRASAGCLPAHGQFIDYLSAPPKREPRPDVKLVPTIQ